MKALLLTCLSTLTLFAQTPAKPAARPRAAAATHAAAKGSLLNPASLKAQAPESYKAKFTTTKGDFIVEVTRSWAPKGADRFYNLIKNGFYTDASFFRVLPGFVVQFGISANPKIGAAWRNANLQDDPVTQTNKRGSLTFATGGPNTRTTQVFINLADNARLDASGFAAFGTVVDGMSVVDSLYSGYGEGAPMGSGPDQGRLQNEGKAYLDKEFAKLDSIKSASIVGEPAAPAAHPAAKPVHRAVPAKKPAA